MIDEATESSEQPAQHLGSPDPTLGGPTVERAVENAEAGSEVEGVHAPFGEEPTVEPGESRGEQLRDVVPGAVPRPE